MEGTDTTIIEAICLDCGYETTDKYEIEAWNGYGDHGEGSQDCEKSRWKMSDGTITDEKANVVGNDDGVTRTCFYCGGYSETPRALCDTCHVLHMVKACEARPGSCHACNMIEMEG